MNRKPKVLKSVPLTLAKVPTGITGFDEITYGGLPLGRTTLIRGGPGCGKTVFAVQSLVNATRTGGSRAFSSPSRRTPIRSWPTPRHWAGTSRPSPRSGSSSWMRVSHRK